MKCEILLVNLHKDSRILNFKKKINTTFWVATYTIKYLGSKYETVHNIISADPRVTEIPGVKI